jgi:hypothetical protein
VKDTIVQSKMPISLRQFTDFYTYGVEQVPGNVKIVNGTWTVVVIDVSTSTLPAHVIIIHLIDYPGVDWSLIHIHEEHFGYGDFPGVRGIFETSFRTSEVLCFFFLGARLLLKFSKISDQQWFSSEQNILFST